MADVERYIAAQVRAQTAYHVPPGEPLVKLDAMENPYSLPLELRDRWLAALRDVPLNRYPSTDHYARLKARLAQDAGLPPGCEVVLGNGSDEILQNILLALASEVTVVAPTPTFVMYEHIATLLRRPFVGVPLNANFTLDIKALQDALARHAPAVLFLACPNNPTGILYSRAEVRALLEVEGALVVIDEAYQPFAQTTFMDEVARSSRVWVLRTFSKHGLAGLRFGWLAADAMWTHELEKVRLPYNVGSLALATVDFALDYADVFAAQAARIRALRAQLLAALADVVTVWPSEANFVLFRPHAPKEAARIFQELKMQGIWIKNLSSHPGALAGCLRVTVGTAWENQTFLAALSRAL